MKKLFKNFYEAEKYLEKIDKKCCKCAVRYLIKCPICQDIICFNHAHVIYQNKEKLFGCFKCSLTNSASQ